MPKHARDWDEFLAESEQAREHEMRRRGFTWPHWTRGGRGVDPGRMVNPSAEDGQERRNVS